MNKLRESARGRLCLVRIPGICSHNPDTVVLAHVSGGGMGRKSADLHGAFCCSSCHDAIDGRIQTEFSKDDLRLMHLEGVIRTQNVWLREGLVK